MTTAKTDPFAQFKAAQREGWSLFAPMEIYTTMPAAKLVKFAKVAPHQRVLDVACGTGVVAVTAARAGAKVRGLDLAPALVEHARHNASLAGVDIDFTEGDAEALPYPDASFDVVLSQFGHIFAPRPHVVMAEMLRVLRPGGRIAFSTWPPELFVGRQLTLISSYMPPPPPGIDSPPSPVSWGDPNVVRERLGDAVSDLLFERATMMVPALSPQHIRHLQENAIGPLAKIVAALQGEPAQLARLRADFEALIGDAFEDNCLRQHFLMTRATKRA
jgi:SAM-dependent methyltransferase